MIWITLALTVLSFAWCIYNLVKYGLKVKYLKKSPVFVIHYLAGVLLLLIMPYYSYCSFMHLPLSMAAVLINCVLIFIVSLTGIPLIAIIRKNDLPMKRVFFYNSIFFVQMGLLTLLIKLILDQVISDKGIVLLFAGAIVLIGFIGGYFVLLEAISIFSRKKEVILDGNDQDYSSLKGVAVGWKDLFFNLKDSNQSFIFKTSRVTILFTNTLPIALVGAIPIWISVRLYQIPNLHLVTHFEAVLVAYTCLLCMMNCWQSFGIFLVTLVYKIPGRSKDQPVDFITTVLNPVLVITYLGFDWINLPMGEALRAALLIY